MYIDSQKTRPIMTESYWQERAKGLLKSELKKRGISYKQLADMLAELGIDESDRNIANKLARGGFSAVFLIQCLSAIGCHTVHLDP
jgi:3-mercaptopyruvate sulfurtransferase SseA